MGANGPNLPFVAIIVAALQMARSRPWRAEMVQQPAEAKILPIQTLMPGRAATTITEPLPETAGS